MFWYTLMVVCKIEAIAAITKSWAKMSLLGKRDGFNVGIGVGTGSPGPPAG